MRELTSEDLKKKPGRIIVLYGKYNVGKSVSLIQTCSEPMLVIYSEKRDFALNLEPLAPLGIGVDEFKDQWLSKGNKVLIPETISDFRSTLSTYYNQARQGIFTYKTIIVDSFSYWLNVTYNRQLQEEAFQMRIDNLKKNEKMPFESEEFVTDMRSYGKLVNAANALMDIIKPFSQFKVNVILVFQEDQNPSYNVAYSAAPYIRGKQFGQDLGAHIDFAGMVYARYDERGNMVFPPRVTFSQAGTFVKWCGKRPYYADGTPAPLDFELNIEKIFVK